MSDISLGDDAKLKVRLFAYFLQKELTKMAKAKGMNIPDGKTFLDVVHSDLRDSGNPGIRKMYRKLQEAGGYMKENHQTAIVTDLGACFLWFTVMDTAYRDPVFWIIAEMFNDPAFMDDIKPYVLKPEEWYCFNWNKAKNITNEKLNNNELPAGMMAPAEEVFVPAYQDEKWRQLQEEMKKQYELHKR